MLDAQLLLDRFGGLARGVELQRHGVSRMALSRAVRSGEIDRLRAGVYAMRGLHDAVRGAALHGGSLTCAEALRIHGIWVLAAEGRSHVWVGRRGRIHEHVGCRCHSHFFRGVPGIGLVDVETALIHLFHCEGDESFFASFESALRQRMLSAAARMRIRAALPAYARWLVDIARADADSGLESIVRLRLHILGILLECQVTIPGVGRVDFLIDRRLILEIDGVLNHDGRTNRAKDLRRDAAASARGYETLRFDYRQVLDDWPRVQAAVLAAVTRTREHA